MHDLALEPRSIEPSATPVQEGGTMDLGSSRLEQAPLNNAAGLWTKQQVTWRCVEKQSGARPDTSAKPQAASHKLATIGE